MAATGNIADMIDADTPSDTAALQRQLAEQAVELESLRRELADFSYSVSHDLRSPLRAIKGLADLLLLDEAARLSPDGRDLLGRMGRNAERMSALIDGMLAYSRAGRVELLRQGVDLDVLVPALVHELGTAFPKTRIEISPLGRVQADPTMLRQIWLALLGNALKFSSRREAPQVQVTAVDHGSERVFSIADNGAGFDMAYAGKLFGMFQRMHGEDDFPGLGVGLAITRRLLERHGGRIWAEATPDGGATFRFTLQPAQCASAAVPVR